MSSFEGNSNASKNTVGNTEEKPKVSQITSNVTVKKESEVKKFGRQFFAEDAKSVKGHIVTSVVIPGIQRLLTDIVKNGIDWLIYGTRGGNSDRNRYGGNISYSNYFERNKNIGSTGLPTIPAGGYRSNIYAMNDVSFMDRGETEEVLLSLKEQIDRYGMVSVGDFYDMIGHKHVFTDFKYGWRDLREAEIVRVRDGFAIRFPKCVPLEN